MTIDYLEDTSERVEKLLKRGVELPTMPTGRLEILDLIRKGADDINVEHLSRRIEEEPTLAAPLLRMANSPRYGTKRTICRINHAIMHIGLDETLSLMSFSLMSSFLPKNLKLARFSMDGYWMHSWVCAHAAKLMGRPQFLVNALPGELYMAGLLHDVGKIVLATYLPEDFTRCLEISTSEKIPLYQIEREILGVDHALLGGYLFNQWHLPMSILDAVSYHHMPCQANSQFQEIAGLIQFADLIALKLLANPVESIDLPDWSSSWIVQEAKTSLCNEPIRDGLLQEIKVLMQSKVETLCDFEGGGLNGKKSKDRAQASYDTVTQNEVTLHDGMEPEPIKQCAQTVNPGFWPTLIRRLISPFKHPSPRDLK